MANRQTQTDRETDIPRYVQTYVTIGHIAAAILPNIKKNKNNAEMSS